MEIVAVGPFVLSRTLGTGATGKVKLGFHKDSGFKVAIKIISKNTLQSRPNMLQKLEREIAIMKFLDHPNVLRLYDVYDTPNYLFLVLEHVEGGELFDYLLSKGRLQEDEALRFFQQLVAGVDYCHSHLICHRDLKPENVLLDANNCIKICDFGMAALMPRDALLTTSCGSPHYASPEVITGRKYNGMEADVWSLGVILYALLVGKLPFDDPNMRKLLLKVKIGVFEMPSFLDKTAKDLIWRMLTVDPDKRAKISEIKQHPWFLSNGAPVDESPAFDLDKVKPFESQEEMDPEVVQTLTALWGDENAVLSDLMADGHNLTKVFYRLIQKRFLKRAEEEKAAAAAAAAAQAAQAAAEAPPPTADPDPPKESSFRAIARKLSALRPSSPSPGPREGQTQDEVSPTDSPGASPSDKDGSIPSIFSWRRSGQNLNSMRSDLTSSGGGGGVGGGSNATGGTSGGSNSVSSPTSQNQMGTPERRNSFLRRRSSAGLRSPTGSNPVDPRMFTTVASVENNSQGMSPSALTGASPRKSWFHFFTRGSTMKPLSKSDAPPLARALVAHTGVEEMWVRCQMALEELDVQFRFSKTLRCLKAVYTPSPIIPAVSSSTGSTGSSSNIAGFANGGGSNNNSNNSSSEAVTPVRQLSISSGSLPALELLRASSNAATAGSGCKLFIRMSNVVTPADASQCTYLHLEFRSGSQEDFLLLFTQLMEKCADFAESGDTVAVE